MSAIQRFFDKWSSRYENDVAGYGYTAPSYVVGELQKHLKKDGRMLDIGAGTGQCSHLAREAGYSGTIIGVDISHEMLKLCKQRGVVDEVYKTDITKERLPFDTGSFDTIMMVGVFEFIKDVKHVLDEIARVLKPGGYVSLTYENVIAAQSKSPFSLISRHKRTRVYWDRWVPRLYNKYYHNPTEIFEICQGNSLKTLQDELFLAYQWPNRRGIYYRHMLLKKRVLKTKKKSTDSKKAACLDAAE